VPNFSFEDPDVSDGATTLSIPGWTVTVSPAQGSAGIYDPVNAQYAGSTGNNSPLPGFPDGNPQGGQTAFISLREAQATLAIPDLGVTVQPNVRYLLTVAMGNRLDANPGNTAFRIVANGVHTGGTVVNGNVIPNGIFQDYEAVLGPLTPTDSRIGGVLGIEIIMTAPQASGIPFEGNFDNVRLTATPEPFAMGVVLSSCVFWWHRPRSRSLYQLPRVS
jgi:hypothetical protein